MKIKLVYNRCKCREKLV